ncbi:hydroxyacylglutathione hydrolase [Desulfurispira natronophila]|uniref:Hydroxyacylglutathione hydrolase n=1 Tax=Desulfurispira natronophila TaxID=682562 RepID=A0A7W8DG30_9BACT|nr:hydroxyacylglutathione hydrolase [Desulfurispira natronophila]
MNVVTLPCLNDNYTYLICCPETNQAAAVDPGDSSVVLPEVKKRGLQLTTILCTHHHADHIGGLDVILSACNHVEVCGHVSDSGRIPGQNRFLKDSDALQVGSLRGKVIHTPGHTSGCVVYHFNDAVFTGDTLFSGGCGRLFEGSALQMHYSLNIKLSQLPDNTSVYFGHEYTANNLRYALEIDPSNVQLQHYDSQVKNNKTSTTPSTMRRERAINPFLRCHEESLKELVALKLHKPKQFCTPEEVFAVIREGKDNFQ